MELNEIKKTKIRWEQTANELNRNFETIESDFDKMKEVTLKNKGYFLSKETLEDMFPTSTVGDKAYVGSSYPYHVYHYTEDGWVDRGVQAEGDESVELGNYYTKNETDRIFTAYEREADEINNISETLVSQALRKTPQVLTTPEKSQVRSNIGAVSMADVNKEYEAVLLGKVTSRPSDILN